MAAEIKARKAEIAAAAAENNNDTINTKASGNPE